MKIIRREVLINKGSFPAKEKYLAQIDEAISKVVWPLGRNNFTINPVPKGNGVKIIKDACMQHLELNGWKLEERLQILTDAKPGPLDAVKPIGNSQFLALEWETGNISSSHRALNKMACGMLENKLVGGVLVLPSRPFYTYLTDRVGNFQELSPYFTMYKNLNLLQGYLAVYEIEHDNLDSSVPLIPKGTDGMAKFSK
ncbi:hypothetical protein QWY82_04005 [Simiduia curdlanivorans]|uniref:Restriction endonuclease n=1 Tax=Simiduia curdlanivorans TaxID=1492769 RepID=A0ABV8V038_9GAMM|nr:hypothetical protein [Simiduia curdlanivorans]MDN3637968.1 hypothetical protein [Simiduia curdlanivorans]